MFDLDDLVDDVPAHNPAAKVIESKSAGVTKVLNAILNVTDAMTVTTEFLRKTYDGRIGVNAFVAPNVVDLDHITPAPRPSADPRLRVGMVYNTNRHGDYVKLIPLLRQMVDDGDIHLTMFGQFIEHFWKCSPKDVRWIKHVKPTDYWAFLANAQLDVVINRMEPHDFNLAKSNIKWLEASMVGAATVTTEWGEMVNTPGAWHLDPAVLPQGWREALLALAQLKKDGKLAERVAISRQAVEDDWSTTSTRVLNAYQKVLDHVEHCHRERNNLGGTSVDDVPADAGERS